MFDDWIENETNFFYRLRRQLINCGSFRILKKTLLYMRLSGIKNLKKRGTTKHKAHSHSLTDVKMLPLGIRYEDNLTATDTENVEPNDSESVKMPSVENIDEENYVSVK